MNQNPDGTTRITRVARIEDADDILTADALDFLPETAEIRALAERPHDEDVDFLTLPAYDLIVEPDADPDAEVAA